MVQNQSDQSYPAPIYKRLIFYFVGSVFFVTASIGLPQLIQEAKSTNWPTTQGIFINSDAIFRCGGKGTCFHEIVVHYNYKVNGVAYQSDRYRFYPLNVKLKKRFFIDCLWEKFDKDAFDQKLSQGLLKVYYDPEHPEIAVLVNGIRISEILGWLAWVGFGCYFFYLPFVIRYKTPQ